MEYKFSKKFKSEFICALIILAIALLCLPFIVRNTVTTTEMLERIYQQDSIKYTTKDYAFAKNCITQLLQNEHTKIMDFNNTSFDESLNAYQTDVTYTINNKVSSVKRVWLRVDFKSNNGDYVIKHRIIKTKLLKEESINEI